jgi:hypothetical protein
METGGPDDGCSRSDCCASLPGPAPVANAPGLPALRYRVDVQPGFYARMLASLPLVRAEPDNPAAPRPLGQLLSRDSADPTVALIDACACLADVLTFYQERIANEGYLGTATERRSVLELARAIGYELKPGVAASVHLAFAVEDAPGSPGVCTLTAGTPVQSVPPQGKLPQVFETTGDLVARAGWNALRPRAMRPADMALLDVPDANGSPRKALVLVGPRGGFPADTPHLQRDLSSQALFRLAPELAAEGLVDAIEVGRVYFTQEAGSNITGGDLLLFAARQGSQVATLVLRAVAVVAEPALQRIRIDVEPLPAPTAQTPPPAIDPVVPYVLKPVGLFARAQLASVPFTQQSLVKLIGTRAWRERDLQAMIGIQRWNAASLVKTIVSAPAAQPAGPALALPTGAFGFSAKLGFFGHNAPKWKMLPGPNANTNGQAFPQGWDPGDISEAEPRRTVWQDSQGKSLKRPHVYLERAVPNVNRAGWVVFDAPDQPAAAYAVFDAREASRADFGLSGRALGLTLAGNTGAVLPETAAPPFPFRSSTAYVASHQLALADLPIDTPVRAGDAAIELAGMVLGLAPGQPVALTGERDDLPGVDSAEIAVLADIVHADGRSTLMLAQPLQFAWRRSSLVISANVVHATHGETVKEVLGSGDAAVPHQRFALRRPPLTYLPAPTPRGVVSTLEVRVNGVRWDAADALYGTAPHQQVYATRIDDDARAEIVFGDGVQGARLPSGAMNVAARYRSGIGLDGEVAANTLSMLRARPLGLRGVTNPVPATGAEGPEQLDGARRNAPLTLLTFERVVSLRDYEDFSRAYPGIGKARADVLWNGGASLVFVTVAGAGGSAPGADVMANLPQSIAASSDPAQRFRSAPYLPRYFSCAALLAVDPRYRYADVAQAVTARLQDAFGFGARALAQSVTAAEVMALMHTVAGVLAVDLTSLQLATDDTAPGPVVQDAVPAFGARWDPVTHQASAAELLLINPAAISLAEMPA